MSLVFDPQLHAYFLNGKQIPSVTQVIKGAGLMPEYNGSSRQEVTQAMIYGTKVHGAVADVIAGNPIDADPFVAVAVMGFVEWQHLYKPDIYISEKLGASEKYGYAGTCDIGARTEKNNWLIDVKTGAYSPWHIVQLSAYNEIFKDEKFTKFGGLYLDPVEAGSFIFKEFKRTEILSGFSVFLNCLNINKWKKNHNG